jgi:hypothetical protein
MILMASTPVSMLLLRQPSTPAASRIEGVLCLKDPFAILASLVRLTLLRQFADFAGFEI